MHRTLILFAPVGCFLLALDCATGAELGGNAAPTTIAELERAIEGVLQDTNTPGAGIAIVSRDRILHVAGLGLADRAQNRAVTKETMFRAGSISKSFTALAIQKLEEAGRINLDARVRDLAPEVQYSNRWEEVAPLRLVHLLEHTAGFDEISLREFATSKPDSQLAEDIDFDPRPRTSRWPPGQFFSYSNADYTLVGYILEKVSGQPFDDFLAEELLWPLQMEQASFLCTENVQRQLAIGYGPDGVTPKDYEHIVGRPSGALNCSPTELPHLVELLLNRGVFRGRRILSTESIERMERPATSFMAQREIRDGYGLANYTVSHNRHRIHGHAGGMNGYLARYAYSIEHGVGYVIMLNGSNGEALDRSETFMLNYLSRDWPQPESPKPIRFTAAQIADYKGFYEPYTLRIEKSRFLFRLLGMKQVSIREDALFMRGPFGPWLEFAATEFEGAVRGQTDAGPTLLFFREGDRTYAASSSIRLDNLRRIPDWQFWSQILLLLYSVLMILSAIGFALIWLPRKTLGYMRGVGHLSVRIVPLAASLSFLGIFAVIFITLEDPINALAWPTIWSIGICALTWLLAILTPLGLINLMRARRAEINRWVWWHSLLVTVANSIVLIYLVYWGVIGIRTWA